MAHSTKVSKQGNSLGVRIPKEYLDRLGLAQGDEVQVDLRGESLEIRRADDDYNQAMDIGRAFAQRYQRALSRLS